MNYLAEAVLTETEHEAMGQRKRSEDNGKVIFASVCVCVCVLFFFLPSFIPHVSMHVEKKPLKSYILINIESFRRNKNLNA